mgnify:CR=1 FL=1
MVIKDERIAITILLISVAVIVYIGFSMQGSADKNYKHLMKQCMESGKLEYECAAAIQKK